MNDAINKLIAAADHDEELRDALLMLGANALLTEQLGEAIEDDDDLEDAEQEIGDLVTAYDERIGRIAREAISEWLAKRNHGNEEW